MQLFSCSFFAVPFLFILYISREHSVVSIQENDSTRSDDCLFVGHLLKLIETCVVPSVLFMCFVVFNLESHRVSVLCSALSSRRLYACT